MLPSKLFELDILTISGMCPNVQLCNFCSVLNILSHLSDFSALQTESESDYFVKTLWTLSALRYFLWMSVFSALNIVKHSPLFVLEQSFVFLSNTNSASTSAAASTSCRLRWQKASRHDLVRPVLPCEVSFYKIQPRPSWPGENDLEIVHPCFEKYHAWGVCELQSSKIIPLYIAEKDMA